MGWSSRWLERFQWSCITGHQSTLVLPNWMVESWHVMIMTPDIPWFCFGDHLETLTRTQMSERHYKTHYCTSNCRASENRFKNEFSQFDDALPYYLSKPPHINGSIYTGPTPCVFRCHKFAQRCPVKSLLRWTMGSANWLVTGLFIL